jgi:hypothetical protein
MSDQDPQNFNVRAGDSKVLKVTVTDENGVPLPLAGTQSATWRLARSARGTDILTKTISNGITILTDQAAVGEPNCGRLNVLISSADSEALDGEYFHDCQIVDATGATSTVFYGRVNAIPNL